MAKDFVVLGSNGAPDPRASANPVDEQLTADGWQRRHSVDVDRVKESVELYESLGFEVLTREMTPADYDPRCRECAESTCPMHILIYTRKRSCQPDT